MNFWNPTLNLHRIAKQRLLPALSILCLVGSSIRAQDDSISSLSLEELGGVPVVVSSKLPSQVFDAPTGSFVFDKEDLEELPVDSIAEMLRYAPGVHIVRPSNGIWGIGMRGINSRFFNRVQFTVDEQNVYSSIFAGLFGNQHDLLMDDVASVEVLYGPQGGTWANNAANGMINVLMKTAFETEGTLVKAQLGTENSSLAARVGWAINDNTSARAYFKGGVRDSSFTRFDYSNEWDTARAGYRIDKRPSDRDLISISGEAFYSNLGYAYDLANLDTGALDLAVVDEILRGVSGQAKWTRNNADGSAYSVRSWISYSDLDAAYTDLNMLTTGIEGRANFRLSNQHFISSNIGAAYDEEDTKSTPTSDFTSRTLSNFAGYGGFQDEWSFQNHRLKLSWGIDAKWESKSDITTVSPNARVIYQLSKNDRLWVSYSEAERTTPIALSAIKSLRSGKAIDSITIPVPGLGDVVLDKRLSTAISDRELGAEYLDAFEVGYRRHFDNEKGSFSLNGFFYKYDDLVARVGSNVFPNFAAADPFLEAEIRYDNLLEGEAYGFEAALNWQLTKATEATLSYSNLTDSFESLIDSNNPFVAGSIQFSLDEFDNSTPGDMASLNLSTDFNEHWNLNTGLRYTGSYAFAKGGQPAIFQADARLSWKTNDNIKISLVGRNLLDSKTKDIRLKDFFGHWTETQRELYLEVSTQF